MAVGALIVVVHWLAPHRDVRSEGWIDLVAGYPMGALLVIGGAVLASRRPT